MLAIIRHLVLNSMVSMCVYMLGIFQAHVERKIKRDRATNRKGRKNTTKEK